jgi:hypothetical protein
MQLLALVHLEKKERKVDVAASSAPRMGKDAAPLSSATRRWSPGRRLEARHVRPAAHLKNLRARKAADGRSRAGREKDANSASRPQG